MAGVELERPPIHLDRLRWPAYLAKKCAVVVQEVGIFRLQFERILMIFVGDRMRSDAAFAQLAAQLRIGLAKFWRQLNCLLQQTNGILMITSFAN